MQSRRFEVLAFCAMLLAAAALFVALLPNTRAANAQQADAPAAPNAVRTDIPATFNYQGLLRNPDGSLMNGSHNVTIRLYDVASGGDTLHTEAFTSIPVRDGLFNVVLGDAVPLPVDFGNTAPIFIGVTIGEATESTPRQRVHPVPWALLADQATTLVPNASVEGLTLNGETKFSGNTNVNGNTDVSGNSNVNGNLTVNNKPLVLMHRYTNQFNNTSWNTGISASDYKCTMGGWSLTMDVNETNAGDWSRWLSVDPIKQRWIVNFETKVHGSPSNPPVTVDVLCFRKEIVEVQTFSNAVTASDISLDNAPADAIPASEDAGQ